jgi:UDP-2,3-diacylglucosamine hydrolase
VQLFISDLHLCEARPETTAAFRRFLAGPARSANTLWILGDLFEYWAGDDDLESAFNAAIADDIAALAKDGVAVRIVVGNRDFLLADGFSARAGVRIEPEPVVLEIDGQRAVLVHGDAECTDDLPYQQFRAMVRNPAWQAQFLVQPLAVRRQIAEQLRLKSEMNKGEKAMAIMDVNPDAIASLLHGYQARILVHGHTHRPARHELEIDGKPCVRWVLSDWHDKATWLEASTDGLLARNEA